MNISHFFFNQRRSFHAMIMASHVNYVRLQKIKKKKDSQYNQNGKIYKKQNIKQIKVRKNDSQQNIQSFGFRINIPALHQSLVWMLGRKESQKTSKGRKKTSYSSTVFPPPRRKENVLGDYTIHTVYIYGNHGDFVDIYGY